MKRLIIIMIFTVLMITISTTSFLSAEDKSFESYRVLTTSELDMFLASMNENLQSVKNVKADFSQERHLSMFLDVLSAKGILYFEMPDKLRWELTEPYASILIFNGGNVSKFNHENGKYVRMNLGMEDMFRESLRQIISILRGDFKNVQKEYNISISRGRDYHLILKPVSAGTAKVIKSIELSIDPGSNDVTTIIIREHHGDYIEIRFSGQEENVFFDRSLFDLSKPLTPVHSDNTADKSR